MRRIIALVEALPPGGAYHVATEGPAALWTAERELAASTVELLSVLIRLFVQANSKKGAALPDAISIPRPAAWEPPAVRRSPTPAELSAFVGAHGGKVRHVPRVG